jgi:anti-sigma factor RsiW
MEKTHDTPRAAHGELLHDRMNALVDGQLPPGRQAELEAQLDNDAAAQDTLQAWKAQREALRTLHRPLAG